MILHADASKPFPLADESVQCCVTSPPFFALRDYGVAGQLGLEATPDEYVARMVDVFREVRRVLKKDGVCWLNLGDSYAMTTRGAGGYTLKQHSNSGSWIDNRKSKVPDSLKPKDLIGIPWRVAFALQADGWWLRQDIIWSKSNPMPESVTDRCTKSHEYIFLLTKSAKYHYDAKAIAEESIHAGDVCKNNNGKNGQMGKFGQTRTGFLKEGGVLIKETRNRRSVWTISTQPTPDAHFATFPEKLVEPCILAGSRPGDLVLDPFGGSGTTGRVAERLNRRWVLFELNPQYIQIAKRRTAERYLDLATASDEQRASTTKGTVIP